MPPLFSYIRKTLLRSAMFSRVLTSVATDEAPPSLLPLRISARSIASTMFEASVSVMVKS